MIWKPVAMEDRALIDQHFAINSYPISDYNFTHLSIWCELFSIRYAMVQDFLVISGVDPITLKSYIYMPIGSGNLKEALIQIGKQFVDQPLLIRAVTPEMVNSFKETVNQFNWLYGTDRSEYEYLYKLEKFKNYLGKDLRRKREQCHAFERNYDFTFTPYEGTDLPQVLELIEEWYADYKDDSDPFISGERTGILALLNTYETYPSKGFVLRVAKKVIGFILAEALTEKILVIHFEKGNRSYKGVYDLMKRELARYYDGLFDFISLEEDMGIDGLRKAKSMYRPDQLIEKGYIEIEMTEGGVLHG